MLKNTTLDDLATIIGFSATIRFSMWFGSRGHHNTYIPATVTSDHAIVQLIGEPAMRRLVDEFGGEHLSVPSLHGVFVEGRNALIRDRFLDGCGARQISEETGLTERRVQQLRREFESLGVLPMILPSKMTGA